MSTLRKLWQFGFGGLRYDPYVFVRLLVSFISGSPQTPVTELAEDTFRQAIYDGSSFIRLGDGEVLLMTGRDIYFQPTSPALNRAIRTIIGNYTPDARYILGVPTNKLPLPEHELGGSDKRRIWRLYRVMFPLRFPTDRPYAPLTQFYTGGYFETMIAPYFTDHHVICISNADVLDDTFRSYIEDTFAAASFIPAPAHDAFAVYDNLKEATLEAIAAHPEHTPLVLGAAGPASKVLAYELTTQNGVQCLDLGHGMALIAHGTDRSHKI